MVLMFVALQGSITGGMVNDIRTLDFFAFHYVFNKFLAKKLLSFDILKIRQILTVECFALNRNLTTLDKAQILLQHIWEC